MRTTILGKNQLSNDSWKKRIDTFHWLRAKGKRDSLEEVL